MSEISRETIEWLKEEWKKADRHVCDLASGKAKWIMCVPPQDDDSDLLLSDVIRNIPKLIDKLENYRKALEHPDIAELDCDCGYFESMDGGTIQHVCVKHFIEQVLSETENEK